MVYPHSVPSAVSSQLEPPKRKRGRPRKYGTPEQALAAKKAATSSSHSFSPRDKKDHALGGASASSSYSTSSKKSHSFALGIPLSYLVGNWVAETPISQYLFILMASLSLCDASSDKFGGTPCLSEWVSNVGQGFTPHVITVAAGEMLKQCPKNLLSPDDTVTSCLFYALNKLMELSPGKLEILQEDVR
ncbi:AT-hook motif nuclear-localized protein 14 [Senna tora]|uniref:AT-hook motif nuclear-localized protein n=1 Tax=Senna tora TaxID=362788 RepID=A0A834TA12_9FABA|nr:AT-hook motif nuclear-localized protein 14 [Senna tora]